MIFDFIKIGLGLLVVVFLPGFLLSFIMLNRLDLVERIVLSIGLSIYIATLISFNLSMVGYIRETRGITTENVWISLFGICVLFAFILAVIKYNEPIKKWFSRVIHGS
mgnify:CR=1 FL=1